MKRMEDTNKQKRNQKYMSAARTVLQSLLQVKHRALRQHSRSREWEVCKDLAMRCHHMKW